MIETTPMISDISGSKFEITMLEKGKRYEIKYPQSHLSTGVILITLISINDIFRLP
jgi:hypothetical protein